MRLLPYFSIAATLTLLGAAPVPDRSSPSAVVGGLYAWAEHKNWRDDTRATEPYLTPLFYKNFAIVAREQRCLPYAFIDFDPFYGVQVAVYEHTVGKTAVVGDRATVRVDFRAGLSGPRAQEKFVTVKAARGNDGWRVYDIIMQAPPGLSGSLANALAGNIAHVKEVNARATAAQRACLAKPL